MALLRRLMLPLPALLLCLAEAPAQATLLVRSDSTGLLVQDKNDLSDRVVVSAGIRNGNPAYVVTNNNSFDVFKFDRQAGCFPGDADNQVLCTRASGKLNLSLLGGGDEVKVQNSGAGSTSVNLGSGNDDYFGIPGPDNVFGATGNDDIETFGGNDTVSMGSGSDRVNAGGGRDRVDIGAGSDSGSDEIDAGADDDVIAIPETTADQLVIDTSGADSITTGSGNDRIVAGSGDLLDPDRNGGDSDTIDTRAGNDRIVSKESALVGPSPDTVKCGFGFDQVEADLTDSVDAGTCDERDISPVGESNVRIRARALTVARSGRIKVRLRCPRAVRKLGCNGRLRLHVKGTSSHTDKVRYRIKARKSRTATLTLARKGVRALRRRQRHGRTTRGALTSVEKGRHGRKTTVRSPRLRLR